MTRKLRLEFPGATYHVINRGNYRQNVFEAKGAADAFERTLGETCERFGWLIHAYGRTKGARLKGLLPKSK